MSYGLFVQATLTLTFNYTRRVVIRLSLHLANVAHAETVIRSIRVHPSQSVAKDVILVTWNV